MTTEKNLGWSAGKYAELAGFDGDWRDSWWNQDYLELLAKRLRASEVRSLLDVGCGAGHWGQRIGTLLSPGARIVGVDHEEAFLEAAVKRAEGRPHDFEYRVASAESLPFEDDAFDMVTCQTVLIHVPDARVALAEMLRVLKPGGVLLACEPNNLVNALVTKVALPRPPFEETAKLLAFEEACLRGKKTLGQGDDSIGEELPHLFTELGLEDVRSYKNDNTGRIVPPYDDPAAQSSIALLRASVAAGAGRMGDRATSKRMYLAGGGGEAEHDALFDLQVAAQARALRDIDEGRHVFGGGFLMYAVAGRKPS